MHVMLAFKAADGKKQTFLNLVGDPNSFLIEPQFCRTTPA